MRALFISNLQSRLIIRNEGQKFLLDRRVAVPLVLSLFVVSAAGCGGGGAISTPSTVRGRSIDKLSAKAVSSAGLTGNQDREIYISLATPRPMPSAKPSKNSSGISANAVVCDPNTGNCTGPTPPACDPSIDPSCQPTPSPAPQALLQIGQFGRSPLSSNSGGYDLVLPVGGSGQVSFYCAVAINGVSYNCDPSTIVTWYIDTPFGAGIQEYWLQQNTPGDVPGTLVIQVNLLTSPGVYTSNIHFNHLQAGVLNPTSPEYTVTILVVIPSAANPPPVPGAIPMAVANAAQRALDSRMSSASAPGTVNGLYACAWAVNQILQMAGLAPLSSAAYAFNQIFVPSLEADLMGGRGTQIDQSATVAGDLVIQQDQWHIGICRNAGCTSVVSNGSHSATFTNLTGPDMGYSGTPRYYRVKN